MKSALTCFLIVAVCGTAIHVVKAQHASRKVFMEIRQLEKTRDELNEEWGRLQLEQSTWAVNDRTESMAKEKLGMNKPGHHSLVFLIP